MIACTSLFCLMHYQNVMLLGFNATAISFNHLRRLPTLLLTLACLTDYTRTLYKDSMILNIIPLFLHFIY